MTSGTPPGVLRHFAGVDVAEYGRQNAPDKRPLTLRYYPGDERVVTDHWYEIVSPLPGTRTIGRWEGRQLRLKTGALIKKVDDGAVIYMGTYFTDEILRGLLPRILEARPDLTPLWPAAPQDVQVVVREGKGKRLWFLINSGDVGTQLLQVPGGQDLLRGSHMGTRLVLPANGVAIIKSK